MGRKKITTVEEDLPAAVVLDDDDQGEEAQAAEEASIQEQMAQVHAKLEGDHSAKMTLKRRGSRELEFAIVELMNVSDFNVGEVKAKFGGGQYKAVINASNGTYVKTISFSIDPRIKGELDNPPDLRAGDKSAEIAKELVGRNADLSQIFVQMMQMQQQQHAQTVQLITAAMSQPKQSGVKDLAAIAAPFIPLALKLIEGRSQDSTLKAIETLAKAKELFGGDGGDSGGGLTSLATSLLKPVLEAKLAQGATQQAQPAVAQNGSAEPKQLEAAPTTIPDSNDPMFFKSVVVTFIRGKLPELIESSKANTDANQFIDLIEKSLDEQPRKIANKIEDALVELLSSEGWAKDLFGDVQLPNPQWFEGFRRAILEQYGPELEPESEVKTGKAPTQLTAFGNPEIRIKPDAQPAKKAK